MFLYILNALQSLEGLTRCCYFAEFPSSYAELNAVFDAYDVTLSGHIGYKDLVKHLDKQVRKYANYNCFV